MIRQFVVLAILFLYPIPFQKNSTISFQRHSGDTLSSRLVFLSDNDLFYIGPESLEMKTLVNLRNHRSYFGALWSPDGTHFALIEGGSNFSGIRIYMPDGEIVKSIAMEPWYVKTFPISWFLGSDRLAVLLQTDADSPQLGIVDAVNGTLTTIYTFPLESERLMKVYWSPNAQWLVYQTFPLGNFADYDYGDPLHLYILDTKTGNSRLLTEQSVEDCVAWSSDGEHIGIVSEMWQDPQSTLVSTSGLTILNINGDVIDTLQPSYKDQAVLGCPFVWSHDNQQIAFYDDFVGESGSLNVGIFVTSLDDVNATLLTSSEIVYQAQSMAWSPDDQYIAVETLFNTRYDVRIVSVDGGEIIYQLDGASLYGPSWQPSGE